MLFGATNEPDFLAINSKIAGLTSRKEKVAHILKEQAIVVNESFWEIQSTINLVPDLTVQYDVLICVISEMNIFSIRIGKAALDTNEYLFHYDATSTLMPSLKFFTGFIK